MAKANKMDFYTEFYDEEITCLKLRYFKDLFLEISQFQVRKRKYDYIIF